ncbi:DUF3213 domain-containing protein [Thermococcus sp. MV11]|nr:DUF3213 domain-containing protein [Thermococcus sp. MV11]NJE04091.1 DUF3213 domain-containing protein [Thermococcus sp. MV11]
MAMDRVSGKRLLRLEFRFARATPDDARVVQYELLKDERVWRAFINGYAKNGFVVFDEEALPREELLEKLKSLEPEVVGEVYLTVEELIESSYSWNNVMGQV